MVKLLRSSIIALVASSFAQAIDNSEKEKKQISKTTPIASIDRKASRNFLQSKPKRLGEFNKAETERVQVFQKVSPSVVNVDNYIDVEGLLRMFVKPSQSEIEQGSGSGYFWDKEGHVVTNYHVVEGSDTIKVSYQASDKSWKTVVADVVGKDISTDIAVLKLKHVPDDIVPVTLGTSEGLMVGQDVLAIGSPFGLDHTLTTGIISALEREVTSTNNYPISNVIQTDASVNPGNSGGPLLDSKGNVIGMNAQILSMNGGGSVGIGFAIPVDTIKTIVQALLKDGYVTRPYMGISYIAATKLGSSTNGLYVIDVEKGGPAQKAGIIGTNQKLKIIGDLIVKINKDKIEKENDIFNALKQYQPGDTIDITVIRSAGFNQKGKEIVLKLTLDAKKSLRRVFRFSRK